MQQLTLSMGSSGKGSTSESSAVTASAADISNAASVVEAAPRRTLDTFGQRTSIYRGVTRWEIQKKKKKKLSLNFSIY